MHREQCKGELLFKRIDPDDPAFGIEVQMFVCARFGREHSRRLIHEPYTAHTAKGVADSEGRTRTPRGQFGDTCGYYESLLVFAIQARAILAQAISSCAIHSLSALECSRWNGMNRCCDRRGKRTASSLRGPSRMLTQFPSFNLGENVRDRVASTKRKPRAGREASIARGRMARFEL
jgi:hypothetical protein